MKIYITTQQSYGILAESVSNIYITARHTYVILAQSAVTIFIVTTHLWNISSKCYEDLRRNATQ